MGGQVSVPTSLFGSDTLEALSSTSAFSFEDEYWHQLLGMSISIPHRNAHEVEKASKDWALRLARNNRETGNFHALLAHLITRLRACIVAPENVQAVQNALSVLFLVRIPTKHFVEHLPLDDLEILFGSDAVPPSSAAESSDAKLLGSLLRTLATALITPSGSHAFTLRVEVSNLLLVLLSTQMFADSAISKKNLFLEKMMEMGELAPGLVANLLTYFIEDTEESVESPRGRSLFYSIGSAAASMILLPYQVYEVVFPKSSVAGALSDRSLLLLLIVSNHSLDDGTNPYRIALQDLKDSDSPSSERGEGPDARGGRGEGPNSVSFSDLYDVLSTGLVDDRVTLALYVLLHSNKKFLHYVLSRTDIDHLVLPLLKLLYEAERDQQDNVYMLLVIVLILTQDSSFCANLQSFILDAVPWYRERLLNNISLGSLLVCVLVRTLQQRFSLKDMYLHMNCLAALANTSPHFSNIHPFSAQRITTLFEYLQKKYKILNLQNSAAPVDDPEHESELVVCLDFIRIVLETINAALTHSLAKNPHLIYAIILKKNLFENFRHNDNFVDLIANIEMIAGYFSLRIEEETAVRGALSSEDVLSLISKLSHSCPLHFKVFPELKFQYEEDTNSEEFFTPYIWNIVYNYEGIGWNRPRATLG